MSIEEQINDTVRKSFNIFKNNYVALIIGTLVALVGMVLIITIPPLIFGIYYMCLQIIKGEKVEISDVFKGFNYFFTSWGLILVASLAVVAGLALLVIPGILLAVLFQYAIPLAILEDQGAINSLKRSYAIGKENFAFSLVIWILLSVISAFGCLTRIGVLLTVPFTALCICIATHKLTAKTEETAKTEDTEAT
ncbi:MAG: hypothetical protein PHD13_00870 [Methanocellales archaeon]|nr:hypothetical protein [Methanocellales archaeon]MDD3291392.1 hypothetical protein [Methanocellales archaeon]MDD5234718.1 hypothetical protein [Methanocellales archaeon]MDD5484931.1 hypothetical protein [Methanocellales archaeon]